MTTFLVNCWAEKEPLSVVAMQLRASRQASCIFQALAKPRLLCKCFSTAAVIAEWVWSLRVGSSHIIINRSCAESLTE